LPLEEALGDVFGVVALGPEGDAKAELDDEEEEEEEAVRLMLLRLDAECARARAEGEGVGLVLAPALGLFALDCEVKFVAFFSRNGLCAICRTLA
jgi:hypothetical protein